MLKLICELIIMSVSGSVMYALSLLFKGRKHAAARYAMLIAAIVIMLIPFNAAVAVPKIFNVELAHETVSGTGYAARAHTGVSFSDIMISAVFFIWITGAAVSVTAAIRNYAKTARVIKHVSKKTLDGRIIGIYKSVCGALSIKGNIDIRISRHLRSPLLFGVLKPRIIIPDRKFTDEELRLIMAHELVHYKHRDLWTALAAAAVRCAHWFNPCAYMLNAAITETRELCCDETVLELVAPQNKKEYGRVIISVIEDGINRSLAYTTAMASPKSSIKNRLAKIAHFKKPSKAVRITGISAVCACAAISVTAFGFTHAAEAVPTELTRRMAEAAKSMPTSAPELTVMPSSEKTEPPKPSETVPAAAAQTIAPEEIKPPETEPPVYVSEQEPDIVPMKTDAPARYVFTVEDEPSPPSDTNENEPNTYTLPETAYIFTPDLSAGVEVRSDNFYASEDITLSVSKNNELTVRLYDAETDRLIYEDNTSSYRKSFSLDMPTGSTYYVTVIPKKDMSVSVYIKAI